MSRRTISLRTLIPVAFFLLLALPSALRAQEHEDFDQYKLRLYGSWFYSTPTGTLQGQGEKVPIDFKKDIGFDSYSTFTSGLDWKFTRKNHLTLRLIRYNFSADKVLQRTFVFRGTTFDAGLQVQSNLNALLVAPGYQYDIIRRKRGHLGLGLQFNLIDSTAKISAKAQVIGEGMHEDARSASGSLFAPIPVAGPQYRIYLTNSPRVFVDGDIYGMYFFGYGNYLSTTNNLGITINKHLAAKVGYELASRLLVNEQTNRLGLHMTQKGPTAGVEVSF